MAPGAFALADQLPVKTDNLLVEFAAMQAEIEKMDRDTARVAQTEAELAILALEEASLALRRYEYSPSESNKVQFETASAKAMAAARLFLVKIDLPER